MKQNGINELIEKLYLKHYKELYNIALFSLNDSEKARDIVQEVFTISVMKGTGLKAHPNKIAWLYAVLGNCIQREYSENSYRTRKKNKTGMVVTTINRIKHVELNDVNRDISFYEDNYMEEEIFEKYKGILNEKEIRLLIYKFEEGLSVQEIAKKFNTTYSNTTTMTSAVFKKIKSFLTNG